MAPASAPCVRCGADLVLGSGRLPYCPTCEPAYHALEMRFEQTQVEATFDEVVQAMIEDAGAATVAVGDAVIGLREDRGRWRPMKAAVVRPVSISCALCGQSAPVSRHGKVPRSCRRCRKLVSIWGEPWIRAAIAAARVYGLDDAMFEHELEVVRTGGHTDRRAQIRAIAIELAAELTRPV